MPNYIPKRLFRIIDSVLGDDFVVGAEVGVERGRTSRRLLLRYPKLHMVLVDLWEQGDGGGTTSKSKKQLMACHQEALDNMRGFEPSRWSVLQGVSWEMANQIKDGSLDLVFIDASHTYEDVTRDLRAWYNKVRSGGVVSGHDYLGRWEPVPGLVKKAVDEFAVEYGYQVEYKHRADIWWFQKH